MMGFAGEIRLMASTVLPAGWLYCNGQSEDIKKYEVLFALIGTTYGGDGKTTFKLPDFRGRVPIGIGSSENVQYNLGTLVGDSGVAVTEAQMPRHSHRIRVSSDKVSQFIPVQSKSTFGAVDSTMEFYVDSSYGAVTGAAIYGSTAISTEGSSAEHYNVMPSMGINYMICASGLWPR